MANDVRFLALMDDEAEALLDLLDKTPVPLYPALTTSVRARLERMLHG